MVGWLDGWMVGWLDGKEIFEYTSDRSGPKTRATRGQDSLRSEKKEILFNRKEEFFLIEKRRDSFKSQKKGIFFYRKKISFFFNKKK